MSSIPVTDSHNRFVPGEYYWVVSPYDDVFCFVVSDSTSQSWIYDGNPYPFLCVKVHGWSVDMIGIHGKGYGTNQDKLISFTIWTLEETSWFTPDKPLTDPTIDARQRKAKLRRV